MTQKAQSLHVTLPPLLKKFVERQVRIFGYATKSDYIQELIRNEIKKEQEKLERMLLEGLVSGSKEYTEKDWRNLRKKALAQ